MLGLGGAIMLLAGVPVSYDSWAGWDSVILSLSLITAAVLFVCCALCGIAARVFHILGELAESAELPPPAQDLPADEVLGSPIAVPGPPADSP